MDRKKWLGLKINIDTHKNISNLITIKQYVNTITNITLVLIKKLVLKINSLLNDSILKNKKYNFRLYQILDIYPFKNIRTLFE